MPLPDEYRSMPDILGGVLDDLGRLYESLERHMDDAAWVTSRFVEILPMDLEQKQLCLEQSDPAARLQMVAGTDKLQQNMMVFQPTPPDYAAVTRSAAAACWNSRWLYAVSAGQRTVVRIMSGRRPGRFHASACPVPGIIITAIQPRPNLITTPVSVRSVTCCPRLPLLMTPGNRIVAPDLPVFIDQPAVRARLPGTHQPSFTRPTSLICTKRI